MPPAAKFSIWVFFVLGTGLPVYAASPALGQAQPEGPGRAASVSYGGDWTGGYVGVQFGMLSVDAAGLTDAEETSIGIHGGYDYDFGRMVLGGAVDFDATDLRLNGAATIDSVRRLKLRGGYDLGRTLLYVTGGLADIETSRGDDTGAFGGVGISHRIGDDFYMGGEVLGHSFDAIGGGALNADAASLSIRGGLRF